MSYRSEYRRSSGLWIGRCETRSGWYVSCPDSRGLESNENGSHEFSSRAKAVAFARACERHGTKPWSELAGHLAQEVQS